MSSRPFYTRLCLPFWPVGLSCSPYADGALWANVERLWSVGLDSLSVPLRSFWLCSWTRPPRLALENVLFCNSFLRRHLTPTSEGAHLPSVRGSIGRLKRSRMYMTPLAALIWLIILLANWYCASHVQDWLE